MSAFAPDVPAAVTVVGRGDALPLLDLSPGEAADRLLRLLRLLPPRPADRPHCAVLAVSGGPDSLALLVLLAEAAPILARAGLRLSVATVDHRLRDGSDREAAFVATVASSFGLQHRTLPWSPGWDRRGNLQARAREARYDLLAAHALELGAGAVVAAHHFEDQLETHLLARARGTAGAGLAGMRDVRALAPGLLLLRPLLGVTRSALRDALACRGLEAFDDPSNGDRRFARVRLRAEIDAMTGDRRRTLAGEVAVAAAARSLRDAALAMTLDALLVPASGSGGDDDDRIVLDAARFAVCDLATASVVVSRATTAAGGAAGPPAGDAARRLALLLGSAADGFAATLNGALVRRQGRVIVFAREFGRTGPPSVAGCGSRAVFDRRFDIVLPPDESGGRVAALGTLGRGNRRERTLPVLLRSDGDPRAAHPTLVRTLGAGVRPLTARSRVLWRLLADLPQ